ncbi:UNKNOWN [Stylonychia lemnae]|uniref:Transmembrane protein n=1 Tax=Stylonychia lemnae TaxID=5949 RepID=A0A078B031_STYLE|nr:UNKNOWN [Stylonychia lemnae]|eukprot:CDW86388.1 UNKNOWN [Stylonychia lemnae]
MVVINFMLITLISIFTLQLLQTPVQGNPFTTYLAQLSSADFTPTSAPINCLTNDDCIDTTFCCSTYSCVHPNICLLGSKLQDDICDYNFECMSRCCDKKRCGHFQKCFQSCTTNNDCATTSRCCSQRQCTDAVVCDANKIKGDYCQSSEECITNYCFQNECTEELGFFTKKLVFALIVIIILIIGGSCLIYYFLSCCKKLPRSRQGSQTRQDSKGNYSSSLMEGSNEQKEQQANDPNNPNREQGLNSGQFRQLWKKGNVRMPVEKKYKAAPIYEISKEYYTSESQNFYNKSNYNSSQFHAGLNSLDQSQIVRSSMFQQDDEKRQDTDEQLSDQFAHSPEIKGLKNIRKSWTTKNRNYRRQSESHKQEELGNDFEVLAQKETKNMNYSTLQFQNQRNQNFRSISPRQSHHRTGSTAQVVVEGDEDSSSQSEENKNIGGTSRGVKGQSQERKFS